VNHPEGKRRPDTTSLLMTTGATFSAGLPSVEAKVGSAMLKKSKAKDPATRFIPVSH
jgi:hypothetical protein